MSARAKARAMRERTGPHTATGRRSRGSGLLPLWPRGHRLHDGYATAPAAPCMMASSRWLVASLE